MMRQHCFCWPHKVSFLHAGGGRPMVTEGDGGESSEPSKWENKDLTGHSLQLLALPQRHGDPCLISDSSVVCLPSPVLTSLPHPPSPPPPTYEQQPQKKQKHNTTEYTNTEVTERLDFRETCWGVNVADFFSQLEVWKESVRLDT